jgi:hypothetical protein
VYLASNPLILTPCLSSTVFSGIVAAFGLACLGEAVGMWRSGFEGERLLGFGAGAGGCLCLSAVAGFTYVCIACLRALGAFGVWGV